MVIKPLLSNFSFFHNVSKLILSFNWLIRVKPCFLTISHQSFQTFGFSFDIDYWPIDWRLIIDFCQMSQGMMAKLSFKLTPQKWQPSSIPTELKGLRGKKHQLLYVWRPIYKQTSLFSVPMWVSRADMRVDLILPCLDQWWHAFWR